MIQDAPARRKPNMGRRRAIVLILVHVAIAAHIVQWKITGSTISPVEPSESMQTLELGYLNAGFIFFVAALFSTFLFGRFFCGWGCHVVALQDLCAWIMKKLGVRPKPFRSRLLVLAPLALAFYMFIWPTLKRIAIVPALEPIAPNLAASIAPAPFPAEGITNRLITDDFWATFASVSVAIPFLLVCGFATVYFLGSKGFCTYGCPYGGFFAPLDKIAIGRIVVDKNKCKGTGNCTAACTSNVRVHEEVREYGKVTDPGCMKCLDCVSSCPNGALSWKFSPASLFAKKPKQARIKRKYDATLTEELALAILALAIFFSVRGAYAVVPMLMAVGIAACLAFMAFKCYRMLREPNARIAFAQLKLKGRLTRKGLAFTAVTFALLLLTAHTGIVNYHRWRGGQLFRDLDIPLAQLLSPEAPPLSEDQTAKARRALEHLTTAAPTDQGGIALAWHPAARLQTAHLHLALGEPARTAELLAPVVKSDRATDRLSAEFARILVMSGEPDRARTHLQTTLANHPDFWETRQELLLLFGPSLDPVKLIAQTRAAVESLAKSAPAREPHIQTVLILARILESTNQPGEALAAYQSAVDANPKHAEARENLAAALVRRQGDLPAAITHLQAAVEINPANTRAWSYLAQLHHRVGNEQGLFDACQGAIDSATTDTQREQVTRNVAMMLAQLGYEDRADQYLDEADRLLESIQSDQ